MKQPLTLQPYYSLDKVEAGCDEAGRGCLAGPVVAAAVIVPKDYFHPLLNDSKKVTPAHRNILAYHIKQEAVAWAVGVATHEEIDRINILQATYLAMDRAIKALVTVPELLLIDGKYFKSFQEIPYHCFIQGDGQFSAIAAASILAKTYRDAYMVQLAQSFPQYGWEKNRGYPSRLHREALQQFGLSPYHRKTYKWTFKVEDSASTGERP